MHIYCTNRIQLQCYWFSLNQCAGKRSPVSKTISDLACWLWDDKGEGLHCSCGKCMQMPQISKSNGFYCWDVHGMWHFVAEGFRAWCETEAELNTWRNIKQYQDIVFQSTDCRMSWLYSLHPESQCSNSRVDFCPCKTSSALSAHRHAKPLPATCHIFAETLTDVHSEDLRIVGFCWFLYCWHDQRLQFAGGIKVHRNCCS